MQSLYLLIPIVLGVVAIAVVLFFWAVNNGQYDDLDKESQRIFFDDDDVDDKDDQIIENLSEKQQSSTIQNDENDR